MTGSVEKKLTTMLITEDDFALAKDIILKKINKDTTKCVESYIDGMSDYIAKLKEIIFED